MPDTSNITLMSVKHPRRKGSEEVDVFIDLCFFGLHLYNEKNNSYVPEQGKTAASLKTGVEA